MRACQYISGVSPGGRVENSLVVWGAGGLQELNKGRGPSTRGIITKRDDCVGTIFWTFYCFGQKADQNQAMIGCQA
jgi:hypothetical protein